MINATLNMAPSIDGTQNWDRLTIVLKSETGGRIIRLRDRNEALSLYHKLSTSPKEQSMQVEINGSAYTLIPEEQLMMTNCLREWYVDYLWLEEGVGNY